MKIEISKITAMASDCPIALTKVSYDQKLPLNLALVINEYLHGLSDIYTKIEGQIRFKADSNFKIFIVGCLPNSEDSETIFSLVDEKSDVNTFHIVKPVKKIDVYEFYISKTTRKVQIFTASKLKDGKISDVSCYELLVTHE